MLVAGQWRAGSAGTFGVADPSTGRELARVPRAGADDAAAAVAAASAALPSWASAAPRERAEVLRRAFDLTLARREQLAFLISLEMGKSLADARGEVGYAAEFFRWFSEEAVRVGGELRTAPAGAHRILTLRRPIGVTLLVTPWNFPLAMVTRKLAPALAAGCTVVVKPAEDTPLTALVLGGLLAEAGVPPGVVNVLTTDRPAELVGRVLADDRVRKLSFTGSTQVGRSLLRQAADRVLGVSMELGGNAPFIVLDDADLDAAVDGAMVAKMRSGGQACTAANRFFVQAAVAGEFADRLAARMAALRTGPATDERTELGPMVNERQVEGIARRVEDSVAAGAKVLLGGSRPAGLGYYYPATVLVDVPADAPVAREEIFGPVAPVVAVRDETEALALANDTETGLAAYVYTADLARGLRVSERLEVGMVGLNRGLVSDPAAPFGGVKQSGLGREGGFEGIHEYLETVYVATAW
ncbi:NAD-dependent succinate-semialdehyde dehydrogenase [Frankia sp. QA3]|uniref:NAD-dependent succinate-semialdehyde dehydrogenase n=1 Tax=Frankia sp. QA3 TaxID=710111 RepID=UPI000A2F8078